MIIISSDVSYVPYTRSAHPNITPNDKKKNDYMKCIIIYYENKNLTVTNKTHEP